MDDSLLEQLIKSEMDKDDVGQLVELINAYRGQDVMREYEFNRFELQFRFLEDEVSVIDILTSEPEGEMKLSIPDFLERIRIIPDGKD